MAYLNVAIQSHDDAPVSRRTTDSEGAPEHPVVLANTRLVPN